MKERIIKSALSLFWRYGIKSVTMDDIAKDLGISKRTIYQHYSDKEAILALVIQKEIMDQKCEIEKLEEKAANPIEQIMHSSTQMQNTLSEMNPALLYDLKKYYPKAWEQFETYKHEFLLKNIRENLVSGIEQGLYRPDIDVDILALLRIEQIVLAFDPTVFPQKKFSMMHTQMQFLLHFLRGILSEKGFEYYHTIKDRSAIEINTHEK
ncbi:TetR/AcrR family transcriptional regulator [Dyadobacter chenhuakuii]|uniref:TetR/AcrR family transcriptional regulator n=1 Tax=Dyadobacter chenhuakuii TaxID=2909339 RepID=A0A9X1TUN0_9BACT|nr:TetR/AcrR family transcriptional regulator [Dyadobacter chenhuakuii]MCF2496135.1 TetR/AcrR family transcriptional regulator [Dyadobacter chenhuakuii]MCF2499568.1 TetR/AcrR family transcriptional regulator [Dyadobacter chenhuakuii]USJ30199.1 TetR/AcrR family transcriptional regulator [Dyadobacter chenhuakuii]